MVGASLLATMLVQTIPKRFRDNEQRRCRGSASRPMVIDFPGWNPGRRVQAKSRDATIAAVQRNLAHVAAFARALDR